MNTTTRPLQDTGQPLSTFESLSALCDGALDPDELGALMQNCQRDAQSLERWHAYQVIGAALRGNEPVVPSRSPVDFLDGVRSRLGQASSPAARPVVQPLPAERVATPSANDSVFRWRLVAGFASVVAVAAVGWNLLATVPAGQAPGAQLAQSPVTAPAPATAAEVSSLAGVVPQGRTVAVDTRQGTVIRDAGLERLLAEHRQHGGMSALQNPTGFIRNATYDADAR